MEKIIEDFFKVVHRFHKCKPTWRGNGELSNVEFLMLGMISYMLKRECFGCGGEQDSYGIEISNNVKHEKAEKEEGITLGEMTKPIGMTMSAASKKISILEKKGLIKRKNSKTDRRNVYITLTKKGEEICKRDQKEKNERLAEIIRRMGEEDASKLIELLNKAFDIVEEMKKEEAARE